MKVLIYPLIYNCIIFLVLLVTLIIFIVKKKFKSALIFALVCVLDVFQFITVHSNLIKDITVQETLTVQGEYTDHQIQAPYGNSVIVDDYLKLYSTCGITKDKELGKKYIIVYYKNSKIIKSMDPLN